MTAKINIIRPFKALEDIVDFAINRQCACTACGIARRYKQQAQEAKVKALQKQLRTNLDGRKVDETILKHLTDQVEQDAEQSTFP